MHMDFIRLIGGNKGCFINWPIKIFDTLCLLDGEVKLYYLDVSSQIHNSLTICQDSKHARTIS